MIDVAILDAVERLLENKSQFLLPALGPGAYQIGGITNAKLLHESAVATTGSIGQQIKGAYSYLVWRNAARTKYWLDCAGATPYKPVLIDLLTDTVTLDDSSPRGLSAIAEDDAGTVWAIGTQSGCYGLYKRTGAALWTQVLTDSSAGTMYYRDGGYYYKSATNNWYRLSGGQATLIVAPQVGGVPLLPSTNVSMLWTGWRDDFPSFSVKDAFARGTQSTGLAEDGSAFTGLSIDPIADFYLASPLGIGPAIYQVPIDSTYSLIAFASSAGSARTHMALAIYNKSSQVIRYIGSLPALSYCSSAEYIDADNLRPFAAKWVDAGLRIWWAGITAPASTNWSDTAHKAGVMRVDIAYQPTF